MLFKLRHYNRFAFILLMILLSGTGVFAQHQTDHQGLLYYFGQKNFNERSRLSLTGGWVTMPADKWNQIELRSAHFYSLKPWLTLTYGQRSYFTFNEGSFVDYELRPIQAVNLNHRIFSKPKVTHRFMVEERFVFIKNYDNKFRARLRYRIDFNQPLGFIESLYIRPMSELFYTLNNGSASNFTHWKNSLALGYSILDNLKIEARYEYTLLNFNVDIGFDRLSGYRLQFVHSF